MKGLFIEELKMTSEDVEGWLQARHLKPISGEFQECTNTSLRYYGKHIFTGEDVKPGEVKVITYAYECTICGYFPVYIRRYLENGEVKTKWWG